jgi:peptide/nickel transport system substrate-binding protein
VKERQVSRRGLLLGGGGALVAASLAGWGIIEASSGDSEASDGPAPDLDLKEAPMLAALVKAGQLPELGKRLPPAPLVVEPVGDLGRYGGDWHTVGVGVEDTSSWMLQTFFYDNMVGWDPAFKGNGAISDVRPNLAESFTANPEGTRYEFKLRRGIKWSDGEPFTADDVVFAVNDIQVHPEISPAPSSRFKGIDGSPCKATKIDDYTVRIDFPSPNALFLQGMCSAGGFVLTAPKHYLSQFHADYLPGGKRPADDWVTAFAGKNDPFGNADRPTLTGWRVVSGVGGGSRAVVERNPYYWKTDPEGRQLPYLDRIVYSIVSDPEVALAQVLNGQVDIHSRTINTTKNKPVLARSRKRGGYDFYEVKTGQMNHDMIMFNLTHKDPVKREIFGNKDFRIGLSQAINRQEVIDAVYAGQGEPWQTCPRPDSPFYDETMAKQYVEFDVAAANEALDRAGYTRQGDSRMGPDGKPIELVVLIATSNPTAVQAFEFVTRRWADVGIKASVQAVDETLFFERTTAGEHDCAVSTGDGGDNPILYPYRYIPTASRVSAFAPAWGSWFETMGAAGEEPPALVAGWLETYHQIQSTTDADEQLSLMMDILAGVRDEFQTFGISLPIHGYGIVKNDFHNVPETVPGDLTFPNVGAANPSQFYTA